MKTKALYITALLGLMLSFSGHATLAGKNVVLVHGFQNGDLPNPPSVSQQRQNANEYWSDYWLNRAEAVLYWSSADRVTGSIKDSIRTQIKQLEAARTCAAGCVFVTHSTGDLVTRDALTRLGQWGVNSNHFRVLTVLDIAGAGGGTELADVAYNVAVGSGFINSLQRAAVDLVLGFTPNQNNIGVLNDLRPAVARSTALSSNSTPRLRFVGAGDQYLRVTKGFIKGYDDSVVPFHSACGSRVSGDYESCNRSIRTNGQLKSSRAPSSLYPYHYPVLMGDDTDHSEAINNSRSGDFATITNDRTFGGIRVDFNDHTERKWWSWWTKVRLVRNGSSKSMSANIYDTLNN